MSTSGAPSSRRRLSSCLSGFRTRLSVALSSHRMVSTRSYCPMTTYHPPLRSGNCLPTRHVVLYACALWLLLFEGCVYLNIFSAVVLPSRVDPPIPHVLHVLRFHLAIVCSFHGCVFLGLEFHLISERARCHRRASRSRTPDWRSSQRGACLRAFGTS